MATPAVAAARRSRHAESFEQQERETDEDGTAGTASLLHPSSSLPDGFHGRYQHRPSCFCAVHDADDGGKQPRTWTTTVTMACSILALFVSLFSAAQQSTMVVPFGALTATDTAATVRSRCPALVAARLSSGLDTALVRPELGLRRAMSALRLFDYQRHNRTHNTSTDDNSARTVMDYFAPIPMHSTNLDTLEPCLYENGGHCRTPPCELIPHSASQQTAAGHAASSGSSIEGVLQGWKADAIARQQLAAQMADEWDAQLKATAGSRDYTERLLPTLYFEWINNTVASHPADHYPLHFLSHPMATTDRTIVWVDNRCDAATLFALRAAYLLMNVDRGLDVDMERRLAEELHIQSDHPAFTFQSRHGRESLFSHTATPWGLSIFTTRESEACYAEALDIRVGGLGEHVQLQLVSETGWWVACRLPLSLDYFDSFAPHIEYILTIQPDAHMLSSVASDELMWARILKYGVIGAPWSDHKQSTSPTDGLGWNGGVTIRRRSFLHRTMRFMNCNTTKYPFECRQEGSYVRYKETHPEKYVGEGGWADDGIMAHELSDRLAATQSFLPPPEEAHRFSSELHLFDMPFFSHAAYKWHTGAQILRVFSQSLVYFMRPHAVHAQLLASRAQQGSPVSKHISARGV